MDQAFIYYTKFKGLGARSEVVEDARQRAKEDAQLRLARITNGVHPDYINGNPKDKEKGR